MRKTTSGFTIVELLIVIVVIAILAAITIVAYNGIQNRANDTAVKNDLATLRKKIEMFRTTNETYPYSGDLDSLGYKASKSSYLIDPSFGNILYCYSYDPGNTMYAIGAVSKSGKNYYAALNSAVQEYAGPLSFKVNACDSLATITGLTLTRSYAGYNPSDTVTGPWRTWVGQ
ncbi:MAG TPA: prepilin-type N-terminal cleavage/methylation domain-containing protein [Candidatus Saccharimonadales bacterium]